MIEAELIKKYEAHGVTERDIFICPRCQGNYVVQMVCRTGAGCVHEGETNDDGIETCLSCR